MPEEVLVEARRFFQRGVDTLVNAGLSQRETMGLLANLEGAMLVANALGDTVIFDEVVS